MSHQWILSKGSNRENPTPSFEDLQGSIFQIPHPLFRDLQGSIFEIPHPVSGIFADFQGSIVSRDLLGSTGSIGIYKDLQGSLGIYRDLRIFQFESKPLARKFRIFLEEVGTVLTKCTCVFEEF